MHSVQLYSHNIFFPCFFVYLYLSICFFQWFDVHNSYKKSYKSTVGCAYGVHQEEQDKVLNRMMTFIQNVYWRGKGKPLPFELGIVCAIKSLQALLCEVKEEGFEYILTSRTNQVPYDLKIDAKNILSSRFFSLNFCFSIIFLCQDVVENFFSCMRGMGGKDHPDQIEIFNRIKIRLLRTDGNSIVPVDKPSVTEDMEGQYLDVDDQFVTAGLSDHIVPELSEPTPPV